jgi:prepilin-type N-terminal cleavage/methylation domain-containing protein
MKKLARGFTLIELLVVIAIIGILSAVVLASLNTAQNRGGDAAVESDLQSIHSQAEIYYNNNSYTYGTASNSCTTAVFSDPTIQKALANITTNNAGGTVVCNSVSGAYAIESPLKSATNLYWCVDAGGQSKKETAALATGATAC